MNFSTPLSNPPRARNRISIARSLSSSTSHQLSPLTQSAPKLKRRDGLSNEIKSLKSIPQRELKCHKQQLVASQAVCRCRQLCYQGLGRETSTTRSDPSKGPRCKWCFPRVQGLASWIKATLAWRSPMLSLILNSSNWLHTRSESAWRWIKCQAAPLPPSQKA